MPKVKSEICQKVAEVNFNVSEPVVIVGFGQMGQVLKLFRRKTTGFSPPDSKRCIILTAATVLMLPFLYMQVLANFLSAPLASGIDGDFVGWPYVAFDLNVSVVKVRNI